MKSRGVQVAQISLVINQIMSTIHTDHLGREINVGDWCAMTQNNEIYVGKIIKISKNGAPSIARNSFEEFMVMDPKFKSLSWKDKIKTLENKFGPGHSHWGVPSWCRQKKFVRINPTDDMIISYDV